MWLQMTPFFCQCIDNQIDCNLVKVWKEIAAISNSDILPSSFYLRIFLCKIGLFHQFSDDSACNRKLAHIYKTAGRLENYFITEMNLKWYFQNSILILKYINILRYFKCWGNSCFGLYILRNVREITILFEV